MNRDETKRAIAVMQAFVDGAEIEAGYGGCWNDIDDEPHWSWKTIEYRVKPKPREWWVDPHGGHAFGLGVTETYSHWVRVREVIDNE